MSTTASVSAATTPRSSSSATSKRASIVVLTLLAATAFAEVTPLDAPLPDGKETTITCELTTAPKVNDVPVLDNAKECAATKGTYHYKLYIPADYSRDPKRRYPCLFIMSPGGNAGMGNMAPWLKAHHYVVVMLVEAKNGPWEPIVGNFLAAHDDVIKRVRIQEGRKVATGLSGGARGSSVFVQIRPGFCGLIMQAAGASFNKSGHYNVRGIKSNSGIACVVTMGNQDGNKKEIPGLKSALGSRLLVLPFEGGHTGAPAELFQQAMEWIESKVTPTGPNPLPPVRLK